jgi:hypothetical protein
MPSADALSRQIERRGYALVTVETPQGTVTGTARRDGETVRVFVHWDGAPTPWPYPRNVVVHDGRAPGPKRAADALRSQVLRHAEVQRVLSRAHRAAYVPGTAVG